MRILISIFYGIMLVSSQAWAGNSASVAALYVEALDGVCDLSAELKGIGKFVEKKLEGIETKLSNWMAVRHRVEIKKSRKGKDCETLSVLSSYLQRKERALNELFFPAVRRGIRLAALGAYAGARVDEFLFIAAGINKGTDTAGSAVSCLLSGGKSQSGDGGSGVNQEAAKSNTHVRKCFALPSDTLVTNPSGVLNFKTHLASAKAGDSFLLSSAIGGNGCPLTKVASKRMFVASEGPQKLAVAGGLIEFDATGTEHANSKIKAHADVFGGDDGSGGIDLFKQVASELKTFKEQDVQKMEQISQQAFANRGAETLADDKEFVTALRDYGLISDGQNRVGEDESKLYEKMASTYGEILKEMQEDGSAETITAQDVQLNRRFCAATNSSTGKHRQGENAVAPNRVEPEADTGTSSPPIKTTSGTNLPPWRVSQLSLFAAVL